MTDIKYVALRVNITDDTSQQTNLQKYRKKPEKEKLQALLCLLARGG
jgi:hypothetical protein